MNDSSFKWLAAGNCVGLSLLHPVAENMQASLTGGFLYIWSMKGEAKYESNGLTIEILKKADNVIILSGGDNSNPTWEEYKNGYEEYFWPNLELLKHAIAEQSWLGITAENIANHYCFRFSTGEAIAFTWRAWGDLMQAIINKKEGYMKYYM